jgi:hypothetical protein
MVEVLGRPGPCFMQLAASIDHKPAECFKYTESRSFHVRNKFSDATFRLPPDIFGHENSLDAASCALPSSTSMVMIMQVSVLNDPGEQVSLIRPASSDT